MEYGSADIAKIAIMMALSPSRDREKVLQEKYFQRGILSCGVDFGGDYTSVIGTIIERSVVSAKREGLIDDSHVETGAVAGAARDAISQIAQRATGFNIGGKIGLARYGEHVVVCVFASIGLLHLNDVAIGMGHRVL